MLKQQIEALEARQKQTTDEIVRLSSRNALLESVRRSVSKYSSNSKVTKHQVVLLELLRERRTS
ncbi:hypothetical protein Plhal304r1_c073g0161031 [Plasmopara halstedii]